MCSSESLKMYPVCSPTSRNGRKVLSLEKVHVFFGHEMWWVNSWLNQPHPGLCSLVYFPEAVPHSFHTRMAKPSRDITHQTHSQGLHETLLALFLLISGPVLITFCVPFTHFCALWKHIKYQMTSSDSSCDSTLARSLVLVKFGELRQGRARSPISWCSVCLICGSWVGGELCQTLANLTCSHHAESTPAACHQLASVTNRTPLTHLTNEELNTLQVNRTGPGLTFNSDADSFLASSGDSPAAFLYFEFLK